MFLKKGLISVALLTSFLAISPAQALEDYSLCQYSEEYIKWSNLSEEEKENTIMPDMCDAKTSLNLITTNNNFTLNKYRIPSKYLTDVRYQQTDSCWAYGTLAAIESNMLLNGIPNKYLSVAHLEFATQDSLFVPYKKNFRRDFNSGGWPQLTDAYVLNHWGPIYEDSMPENVLIKAALNKGNPTIGDVEKQKAVVDVNNIIKLKNGQGVCSSDAISNIKKYITRYGAIGASYFFDGSFEGLALTPVEDKYNINTKYLSGPYYYYNGDKVALSGEAETENHLANHLSVIVGWDDTISKDKFATKPSRDGAWIVKNSYGKTIKLSNGNVVNIGDNGYFYVSYDDINICSNLVGYYDVDNTVSDYAYYYDYLGKNAYVVKSDAVYLANVFKKKDKKAEKLDKISFAVEDAGYKYTVYYASNATLKNYVEIGKGTTEHAGYISVDVNKSIYVSSSFSVIVKLEAPTINVAVAIKPSVKNDMYLNFEPTSDVSYVSSDGVNWSSFTTGNKVIQNSIRAYTTVKKTETTPEVSDKGKVEDKGSVVVKDPNNKNNDTDKLSSGSNVEEQEYYDSSLPRSPQTGVKDVTIIAVVLIGFIFIIRRFTKNKIYKIK